jgi:hypothetical protein
MSLLLTSGFAIAVFACLFLYIATGMVVGDFQANVFLAVGMGFSAVIGAAWWWFRTPKTRTDS